jgi:hypothetical protein
LPKRGPGRPKQVKLSES